MTKLSVNINKIALLRNSRGRDYPNVVQFAKKFIALGADGITVHPRQDQRHITNQDVIELSSLIANMKDVEFNIEGYPSEDFLQLVEKAKPEQCTLVPDSPGQLTSNHGWDLSVHSEKLNQVCSRLNNKGIRSAIFIGPDLEQIKLAPQTATKRIELYTESWAEKFSLNKFDNELQKYNEVALAAQALGIEVNAGHDLDLNNLAHFLTIKDIKEVSIGHALIVESIEQGIDAVMKKYVDICKQAS